MNKTLYQKYRPRFFPEVIGQEFIKTVLLNSIRENKVQGTYLFSGPRGTGKTSIAKIFARAINCADKENPLADECEACQYFNEETSYEDIYELDAASNNGVDDIRQIIDSVQYQPIKLSKKVYIIDEVHMLSKGAFNALLKTLEEPIDNCVFILATTEPNKIPLTILSRCQRFDFTRISNEVMISHLKEVLEKEKITCEEEALQIICDLSDGCVRDALSLLQKLILGSQNITVQYMQSSLGILTGKQNQELLDLLLASDLEKTLNLWQKLYLSGINVENFIVDFQFFLKNKLIKEVNNQTQKLMVVINKINEVEQKAVYTKNLSILMEVTLIDIHNTINQRNNGVTAPPVQTLVVENDINTKESLAKVTTPKNIIKKDEVVSSKPFITKTSKTNVSIDNTTITIQEYYKYHEILKNATKEERIKITKQFIKIGSKLTEDKKHGLAKFFLEGQIKVANADSIIVSIEEHLVEGYNDRLTSLKEHIEEIQKVYILTDKQWNDLKKMYIKKSQEPEENTEDKVSTVPKEEIVDKLEEKLKVKVNIVED